MTINSLLSFQTDFQLLDNCINTTYRNNLQSFCRTVYHISRESNKVSKMTIWSNFNQVVSLFVIAT